MKNLAYPLEIFPISLIPKVVLFCPQITVLLMRCIYPLIDWICQQNNCQQICWKISMLKEVEAIGSKEGISSIARFKSKCSTDRVRVLYDHVHLPDSIQLPKYYATRQIHPHSALDVFANFVVSSFMRPLEHRRETLDAVAPIGIITTGILDRDARSQPKPCNS